jgi:hypothetical protein
MSISRNAESARAAARRAPAIEVHERDAEVPGSLVAKRVQAADLGMELLNASQGCTRTTDKASQLASNHPGKQMAASNSTKSRARTGQAQAGI